MIRFRKVPEQFPYSIYYRRLTDPRVTTLFKSAQEGDPKKHLFVPLNPVFRHEIRIICIGSLLFPYIEATWKVAIALMISASSYVPFGRLSSLLTCDPLMYLDANWLS